MKKRFSNLGSAACTVIYVVNALLLVGFLALTILIIAPLLTLALIFGALPEAGNRGNLIPLALIMLVVLWTLASFICFVGVIVITAIKKRWNWILQFLPFATAGLFYLILKLAL